MKITLILQTLKELGEATADVFFTDYYSSCRNIYRRLYGRKYETKNISKNDKKHLEKEKHKFYNLLVYLRKQGFVSKKKTLNKITYWLLTQAGMTKLNKLLRIHTKSAIIKNNYEKDFKKIIIFDIPEKERFKRSWLRSQLIFLDFEMLQKSVWIGDTKLPEEFLEDLERLGLSHYVHIFGINKIGTLDLNKKD